MTVHDMDQVMALSEVVHPSLPEGRDTQLQRLRVFPEGCLVLASGAAVGGYAFAHPIIPESPPALDTAPSFLPPEATHLYLHDFVVSVALRGGGHARAGVESLLRLGEAYEAVSLISVYSTSGFWSRFGFQPRRLADPAKLVSYGEGAVFMLRPTEHAAYARPAI